MSRVKELFEEGKRHRVIFKNKAGNELFELSVTWAVICAIAVPELAVLVAIGAILEIITIDVQDAEAAESSRDHAR